jgi:hypothetical protein
MLTREAADIDDPALTAGAHDGDGGSAAVEDPRQVRGKRLVPVFIRQLSQRRETSYASIVDEDVQPAQLVHSRVNETPGLLRYANINRR